MRLGRATVSYRERDPEADFADTVEYPPVAGRVTKPLRPARLQLAGISEFG